MGATSAIVFSCKCYPVGFLSRNNELGSAWSCVWNGQERYWHCGNEHHAPGIDHEIDRSCSHGGYYCDLWVGRCCLDLRWTYVPFAFDASLVVWD